MKLVATGQFIYNDGFPDLVAQVYATRALEPFRVGAEDLYETASRIAAHLAAATTLLDALKRAESIMWMARQYAGACGPESQELRDFTAVAALVRGALASAS